MPEGPEIRRQRDRLQQALGGSPARRIRFHLPALAKWNGVFDGCRILGFESRGKALLTHLEGGCSLYSHNQLYGRWWIVPPGRPPETRRSLRLAIEGEQAWGLLYSASEIQVWETARLAEHPFLRRLGPDVLDARTTTATVLERLEAAPWRNRRLGSLLTDQSFLAGPGNYLRCEILFVSGLHPERRPRDLAPARLAQLADAILHLPRQSWATGGVTCDLRRYEALRRAGAAFEAARFFVYRRAGAPCYRCGGPVRFERRGGQGCYLCPTCQPAP